MIKAIKNWGNVSELEGRKGLAFLHSLTVKNSLKALVV